MPKNGPEIFILSPLYQLPSVSDMENMKDLESHDELKGLVTGQSYILHETVKDKVYIINHTIHYFLTVFSEKRTVREAAEIVAQEANCTPEDLKDVFTDFGTKMLKKGILIPFDKYDEVLSFKNNSEDLPRVLTIGQKINGYTITSELSIRKATELYVADRPEGLGECVIKVVRYTPAWSDKKRKSVFKEFCQEFKLLSALSGHPSVCQLYDLFEDEDLPMAAMERIGGTGMRTWLKKETENINIAVKVDVLVQVSEAICWAHKNDIFHGDIHLSNFLVDNGKVKVIDFGLGNRVDPESDEIINKGGVYQYIAPECLTTNSFKWLREKASHASEVYQLGVMTYYLLYGDLPFNAITWETLANKILAEEAVYNQLDSNGEVIPSGLIDICKRCLQKDPAKRFENAITLHNAFLDFQKSNAVKQVSAI